MEEGEGRRGYTLMVQYLSKTKQREGGKRWADASWVEVYDESNAKVCRKDKGKVSLGGLVYPEVVDRYVAYLKDEYNVWQKFEPTKLTNIWNCWLP